MIAVSGVSMRYGSKVLFDEVTTTFSAGRRYGLTGPNGAGKSTFMKLLSGDLEPQKGSVSRPARLGILRQDQFAFDAHRVIDTVIMGNAVLWSALEERDRLYAKPTCPTRTACASASSKASSARRTATRPRATRPSCSPAWTSPTRCTSGRWPSCRAARRCACCWRRRCSASPRRCCSTSRPTTSTSTPSTGCASSSSATTGTLIVISHDRHFLNAVCTHIADIDYETIITYTGGYDDMVVAKTQIRVRLEVAERAAREEDRAAERLHRPLLRRHAVEPGAVAAQGSRAAADDGPGAVEHPAPVHPFQMQRPSGRMALRVRRT